VWLVVASLELNFHVLLLSHLVHQVYLKLVSNSTRSRDRLDKFLFGFLGFYHGLDLYERISAFIGSVDVECAHLFKSKI